MLVMGVGDKKDVNPKSQFCHEHPKLVNNIIVVKNLSLVEFLFIEMHSLYAIQRLFIPYGGYAIFQRAPAACTCHICRIGDCTWIDYIAAIDDISS